METFYVALGAMVSAHKIDYWSIRLNSTPEWILVAKFYSYPGVIVRTRFEVGLLLIPMWDLVSIEVVE